MGLKIGDVVYHDMITSGGAVTEVKKTLVKVRCFHDSDEYWFKKDSLRLHKLDVGHLVLVINERVD